MKILVISDTHSNIKLVDSIFEIFKDDNIDTVIHCGDNLVDAKKLQKKYSNIKFYMVAGNCDPEGNGPEAILEADIGGVHTMVVHGHKHYVNLNLDTLLSEAKESGAKLVAFGHTHIATVQVRDGITIVNPGSLSQPRDGIYKSFAIVTICNGVVNDVQMWQFTHKTEVTLNTKLQIVS
ncbi:MAG: hypothetical protein BEN18_01975 [Epulopiscium sp. Nuni2H_MBin001]|nr:MAG: hypothetical protein BEN18_01975 [Epulopiscium sp. Nuni2H_MBin001]